MKIGDKIRIKNNCDIIGYRGRVGVIKSILIEDPEVEYPFYVRFIDNGGSHFMKCELAYVRKKKPHTCGVVCKKCNYRELMSI